VVEQRFPRRLRIRGSADFDRVYRNEAYAADAWLVARGDRNGLEYSRLGLSVSRRVGNAVVRNRWKRLVRESFRRHRAEIPAGYDFVVRPRRGATPEYHAIADSLVRLLRKLSSRLSRGAP
jgi:ribonuclease P protein component